MNSSNETYYPLEYWLAAFGYPSFSEILSLYVILPLGLISFAFNVLTFIILLKPCFFGSVFFSYMKLYIFNGIILSLVSSIFFVSFTYRVFDIGNSYDGILSSLYITTLIQPIVFLYSALLEICIVIERSLYFLSKRLRKIHIIEFNKLIIILFLLSVVVHLPFFFLYVPSYADVQLKQQTRYRIWFINYTDFSFSLFGKILIYAQYLIRDISPLIAKIILNSLLIYLVISYKNKSKKDKIIKTQMSTVFNLRKQVNITNGNYISKKDRNQAFVSLIMCIFSMFEHILTIVFYMLFFINLCYESNIVYGFATLAITIKQLTNIFILYIFNSLFRTEIQKLFNFNKIN